MKEMRLQRHGMIQTKVGENRLTKDESLKVYYVDKNLTYPLPPYFSRNSTFSATKSGWRFYRAFYSFKETSGNQKVPETKRSFEYFPHQLSNMYL